jgi:integrase/recombinase XerD
MTSKTEVPQTLVGPLLQSFFMEHLCNHKRLSPQTVKSYRDTFRLLLQYLQAKMAKKPSALSIADLDAPVILSFLESLEQQRHNQAQSRNVRLTAIRSFFRLVALRDPTSVGVATRVLAIPLKRIDQHLVGYLTRPEVDAILAANQLTAWSGRRDYALLLSLYNTGARVSEIISLQRSHFRFGVKSFVQFKGKGRKERSVPLWHSTAKALQAWFRELDDSSSAVAFPNVRGSSLTRDGVNYILQQAVERASASYPSLKNKRVFPHIFRHSCALHLLQSGVDIAVIALWLGHESIQTTHGYIEADLAIKEQALQKLAPAGKTIIRFKADDALLTFLASL